MKKSIVIIISILFVHALQAQTFAEWFRQKKTQIKYLTQQIAALHVYAGNVEKGYQIVKEGTDFISNIKHEDFALHNNNFESLKSINPFISSTADIQRIYLRQLKINRLFKKLIQSTRQSGQFRSNELIYFNAVYTNVMQECSKDLDELTAIVTPGALEMKDDERINRILQINDRITEKYLFTISFNDNVNSLSNARIKDQRSIIIMKSLHK